MARTEVAWKKFYFLLFLENCGFIGGWLWFLKLLNLTKPREETDKNESETSNLWCA